MMDVRKDSKRFYLILSMLVPMVINSMSFFQAYDIVLIQDEIGSMASTAALAGLDWKNALSTCKYYGVGFHWVYAVFYKIMDDPLRIYIGIHFLNYLFASLCSGMSYRISIRYLKFASKRMACLAACLAGITGVAGGFKIYNETGIYFTTWIAVYLLLELFHTQAHRVLKTILLAAVLTWQQLIHTRTVIFAGVVVIIVIFFGMKNKKSADGRVMVFSLAAGYAAVKLVKRYVLAAWWLNSGTSGSGFNASVPLRLNQPWIFTWEGIKITGKLFLSNILTAANHSCGILFCALLAFVFFLGCCLKKSCKMVFRQYFEENTAVAAMYLCGLLTVLAMFAAIIYLNGYGVYTNMYYGTDINAKWKAFHIYRYYYPYLSILYAPVVKVIKKIPQKVSAAIPVSYTGLCILYWARIRPVVFQKSFHDYILLYRRNEDFFYNYLITAGLVFVFLAILILFENKNVYFICILFYVLVSWAGIVQKPCFTYSAADGMKRLYDQLDEAGDYEFYCNTKQIYSYQFFLYQESLVYGVPSGTLKQDIIWLSRDGMEQAKTELDDCHGWYYVQIDDNEQAYIYGEELIHQIENLGYPVLRLDE